ILRSRERDRVHEEVELAAESVADLAEDARDVIVRADVAFGDQLGVDGAREVAYALLDLLPLVRERELRTAVGKRLRDRPGDRALVRDPHDEPAFAFELSGHPRDPIAPTFATLAFLASRDPASRLFCGAPP